MDRGSQAGLSGAGRSTLIVVASIMAIGIGAIGCSGGGNGGGMGSAGTGGASGTGGTSGSRRIIDCGIHSTIGSCGPVSDNCYCSGTRCENPSAGNYFCVFTCVFDSDCVFDIKYAGETVPWEGTCSGGSGSKYCVAKSPTGTGGSGSGTAGSGGPGSGGSGSGAAGSGGPGAAGSGGPGTAGSGSPGARGAGGSGSGGSGGP